MLLSKRRASVMYVCVIVHELPIHVVFLIEVLLVMSSWGSSSLVPCIIHDLLQPIYALRAWLHQLLCCLAAILHSGKKAYNITIKPVSLLQHRAPEVPCLFINYLALSSLLLSCVKLYPMHADTAAYQLPVTAK